MSSPAQNILPPEPEQALDPAAPPPLLERFGLNVLLRQAQALPPIVATDAVHVLNEAERRALAKLSRGAIFRAALAGALSALAAAVAEAYADDLLGVEGSVVTWQNQVQFWAIVGSVTVVASILEIGYLYWDSLRTVHRLARAAGLPLFSGPTATEARTVAAALARAALELPNPKERLFGIDPQRETSKSRLLFASLVYKLKIAASNFVAKLIIRKLLGRFLVRSTLAFVAVPITAIWNGLVAWWVLREARLRAMGPSAIEEAIGFLLPQGLLLSEQGREAALRSVAASIVRTRDLHPNLRALLLSVHQRIGGGPYETLDDPKRYLALLPELSASEQRIALRLLGFAAIIDGRLTRDEHRLVREARVACGRAPECDVLLALHRSYVDGYGISEEALERLAG